LSPDAIAINSCVKKYLKNSFDISCVICVIDVNNMTSRKTGIVATRMTIEELDRFQEIVERAKRRNHLADRASVARELMGFPAVPRTVTDEDRLFLVSGEVRPQEITAERLNRRQRELISKLKDILLYGESDDLDENYAVVIAGNIKAMWVCLEQSGAKTKAKLFSKKKKTLPPPPPKKSRTSDVISNDDIIDGDRPPPG
jgi:hypothetical protein